ncbi:MAG: hypothetical protein V1859_10015 [archaeon]
MLYAPLDNFRESTLVEELLKDFLGWAFVPTEYRTVDYRVFIEYMHIDDLKILTQNLLEFSRGIPFSEQFEMAPGVQFGFARRDILQARQRNYRSEDVQTRIPDLDWSKETEILGFWDKYADIWSERFQRSKTKKVPDLQPQTVAAMYLDFFNGWRRAKPLEDLILTTEKLQGEYAGNFKINADVMGYSLLRQVRNGIIEYCRQEIIEGKELSQALSSLYIKRISALQLRSNSDEMLLPKDSLLKPLEELAVESTRGLIRARNIIRNYSLVVFGSENAIIPYGAKNIEGATYPQLEYAAKSLLCGIHLELRRAELSREEALSQDDLAAYGHYLQTGGYATLMAAVPELFDGNSLKSLVDVCLDASGSLTRARRLVNHFFSYSGAKRRNYRLYTTTSYEHQKKAAAEIIAMIYHAAQ